MSNPIYQQMQNGANMGGLEQKIQQLKSVIKGDPQQIIQQMLNSGKISQQAYNNAVQQAQQIMKAMKH